MHSLFEILSPTEKGQLFSTSKVVNFPTGSVLFKRNDKAAQFYQVKTGQVKLFRKMATGEEAVLKIFKQGDIISDLAMFLPNESYPMTAIAETDASVHVFHKSDLMQLIQKSPELSMRIMGFMTVHISQLLETIDTLTLISADQRLVMFLAQQCKIQKATNLTVKLPFPKKVLANRLSIKPETLSRILKRLKDENLILEHSQFIQIANAKALCDFVQVSADLFDIESNSSFEGKEKSATFCDA